MAEIVRDAGTFSDWDALLALIVAAFAPMTGRIDPPSSALRLDADALAEKARREWLFLARDDGLAGCLFAEPRGERLYLGKLAVAPGRQRRGIGRALVAAAGAAAREAGLAGLDLETRVELAGNHVAFARLGFVEAGRAAHPGFDRPTSVTMRLDF